MIRLTVKQFALFCILLIAPLHAQDGQLFIFHWHAFIPFAL